MLVSKDKARGGTEGRGGTRGDEITWPKVV